MYSSLAAGREYSMKYKVERIKFITREYVRKNRDKLFLFGDNLERRGFGGQAAAMRVSRML